MTSTLTTCNLAI